jgi:hypothetical protein
LDVQVSILRSLPHIDDATDTVSSLHLLKSRVDIRQWLAVSDEFVNLESTLGVIVNQGWELAAALDSAKGTSFPDATGDELEC